MHPTRLLLSLLVAAGAAADRYHAERAPAAPSAPSAASAAAAAAAAELPPHWYAEAQTAAASREARGARGGGRARRLVMFLGDGMSVPTLAAARTLLGQRRGATGEEAQLPFEAFPTVGLAKTYCVNAQIPDSACTATAYLCGAKANYGTLGLSAAVPRHDCAASAAADARVSSLAEWALAAGMDAGIVTTTRVTHASPAGAYAKSANRNWESDADVRDAHVGTSGHDPQLCPDIALQLIRREPGSRFKVILGGGRREFRPLETRDEQGAAGRRADGRDLVREWREDKLARNVSHAYVWNATELRALAAAPPDHLLGLFESSHLRYNLEAGEAQPSLAELTEVALRVLDRNRRGFFLFVEGGRIDHAHHDNQPRLALDETLELGEAVARAVEMLPEEDSLIVVTADHAHVMAFNGYSDRGSDILGPSRDLGSDGVPYMTLSYTNGPGAREHRDGARPDVTQDATFGSPRWHSHADVPLESETHGGDDVAVFARGVAHGMFSGLYEQSQLPHLMAQAACIGPGPLSAACQSAAPRPTRASAALAALAAAAAALFAR